MMQECYRPYIFAKARTLRANFLRFSKARVEGGERGFKAGAWVSKALEMPPTYLISRFAVAEALPEVKVVAPKQRRGMYQQTAKAREVLRKVVRYAVFSVPEELFTEWRGVAGL